MVGATLACPHGGQIKLLSGDPRLQVGTANAVVSGMEVGLSFASPVSPPSPRTVTPCTATAAGPSNFSPCIAPQPSGPSGLARKLFVGGRPALLETATGLVVNAAFPPGLTWRVADPGQSKLEAT